MQRFRYVVLGADGKRRSGHLEARTFQLAKGEAEALDGVLLDLQNEKNGQWFRLQRQDAVSVTTYEGFLSSLVPLLSSGAVLTAALNAIEKSAGSTRVSELASALRSRLEAGQLFSEAIAQDGGYGRIIAAFVEAGEKGAGIDRMCQEALTYLKTNSELKKEIEGALAYPTFVILMAVVSIVVLSVFVAPEIAPLMGEGKSSGSITALATVGAIIKAHFSIIAVLLAMLIACGFLFRKRLRLAALLEYSMLSMPFVQDAYRDWRCAPVARTIGGLLGAGVSFRSALEAGISISSGAIKNDLLKIRDALSDGVPLNTFLQTERTSFPDVFTRLILVSDAAGNLDVGFQQAGNHCQASAVSKVKKIASVLGPAVVITIGGMVALLMLAFMSGLLSLSEGVS